MTPSSTKMLLLLSLLLGILCSDATATTSIAFHSTTHTNIEDSIMQCQRKKQQRLPLLLQQRQYCFRHHHRHTLHISSSSWNQRYHPITIKNQHPKEENYPATRSRSSTRIYANRRGRRNPQWEGDDIRWIQRVKRRWMRKFSSSSDSTRIPILRNSIIGFHILFYIYEIVTTIHTIRIQNPSYWPHDAGSIIIDTVLGKTSMVNQQPLTMNFIYSNYLTTIQNQPHRWVTSGFLHSNILHLGINMDAISKLPNWLETGIGKYIFLTTYIVSMITGNLGHYILTDYNKFDTSFVLGASGGICGLYGLMFVCLCKMKNNSIASRILKNMSVLLLYGLLVPNISTASHIGGFLGGVLMGILFSPNYKKDYLMRRKWSMEMDIYSKDYRQVMGFGITPSSKGLIPVYSVWIVAIMGMLVSRNAQYRNIPITILQGILHPGALYPL